MKVILVSCCKVKDPTAIGGKTVAAKDLYQSQLFKKSWAYAQKLNADRIYILSAKHELLDPNKQIGWYDKTLKNMLASEKRVWARNVLCQMSNEGLDLKNDEFIFLTGKSYYVNIIPSMTHTSLPFAGKRIGEILHFFKYVIK